MKISNNISTNILRDESKLIDYVATPNAKEIFDRIFNNTYGSNKSFNLIGNYGTGKSTFLWALERNLNKERIFFGSLNTEKPIDFEFLKIIGENASLIDVLKKELNLKGKLESKAIINALETKRNSALENGKGLVIIIDEFGKFLEFASKNKSTEELFLLQQISEWANDDDYETYFIITLHQNFSSYGKNLSNQDKLEWEKVKGRFTDLVFNEPVEQLIFFAGKKLKEFELPQNLEARFNDLLDLIRDSKLVGLNKSMDKVLSASIYPLDWLSANVLVNSLQRYGQNERSLFSFLNDDSQYSINNGNHDFYSVSNVFDYLLNSLPTEVNSSENPHRAQWLTTFRALEKAELIFEDDFEVVSEVIKTIGLVNIFSKIGGRFDENFIESYFKIVRDKDVEPILTKLKKAGILRFYKHSNKINFLEGTDIDLEQELLSVNKEINNNFSLSNEIIGRVDFPVILAKKYSFLTGTNRFFEFKVLNSIEDIDSSEGAIDGYINLIFDGIKQSELKEKSKDFQDNIFVFYHNAAQIRNELLMILKFDKLLEMHQMDKNALKLLIDEREFHVQNMKNLVVTQLFDNDKNIWINQNVKKSIKSKHELYNWLTDICDQIYPNTPTFRNELINKEFLSSPINTARKALIRNLLENEQKEGLGFPEDKFPPEKAIYISLLGDSGIHQRNAQLNYFELGTPEKDSNLFDLWKESENFLAESISNKRNVKEFYELLERKPYKLKKGFIDFWIPMFLIAKREDYALFHVQGGFIPFLKEDTLDLIHKKPQDFLIKSYDVSGLKVNLLESYKELVGIGDTIDKGKQSTFLSVFGNFLRFQRGLNSYELKTKRLSSNAIKLRGAIINSKDPEDALFNQFPAALNYHTISIKKDEKVLNSFTKHIKDAIREIESSYKELLNRIEKVIVQSFYCDAVNFEKYKQEINSKISGIDSNALGQIQGVYYKRITSPLDDRNSWLKSVADVALGKSVEELLDEEEEFLMNNIKDLSLGIIKAAEIKEYNKHSSNGTLYSIRFFGENGEFVDSKLVVDSDSSKEFGEVRKNVSLAIKRLDVSKRKELLIELLSQEIKG
jgi:hypothetical protein